MTESNLEPDSVAATHPLAPLATQVARVRAQWQADLEHGGGYAAVPDAVAHKCPRASRELAWQYLFPSAVLRFASRDQRGQRWHTHPTGVDRAVRRAARDRINSICNANMQKAIPPAKMSAFLKATRAQTGQLKDVGDRGAGAGGGWHCWSHRSDYPRHALSRRR